MKTAEYSPPGEGEGETLGLRLRLGLKRRWRRRRRLGLELRLGSRSGSRSGSGSGSGATCTQLGVAGGVLPKDTRTAAHRRLEPQQRPALCLGGGGLEAERVEAQPHLRAPHAVHVESAWSVHALLCMQCAEHTQCASRAPLHAHMQCTRSAPSVHAQCTLSAYREGRRGRTGGGATQHARVSRRTGWPAQRYGCRCCAAVSSSVLRSSSAATASRPKVALTV